jgi:hemerythrin superfamily protein
MAQQSAPELIRADHRKVEELFFAYETANQYETASGQPMRVEALIKQICQELDVHARLEEEIFYPAVQATLEQEGRELVAEAIDEHQTIKDRLAQLKAMGAEDPSRDSVVRQLKECVQHHVEEEEKEILPKSEEWPPDQLESLAAQMQQRKQQLHEMALLSMQSEPQEQPRQ